MSDKCDYIVSNTVRIVPKMARVIYNDLYRRHGKYTYEYPTLFFIDPFSINIGLVSENMSILVAESYSDYLIADFTHAGLVSESSTIMSTN